MSSVDHLEVFYRDTVITTRPYVVFYCTAIARVCIRYLGKLRCRVAIVIGYPVVQQFIYRQKITTACIRNCGISSAMYLHDRSGVGRTAVIEVISIHSTCNRCDGCNAVAQLTGQFIAHESSVAHTGRVDPVLVDIVFGRDTVQQIADKGHIIHTGAESIEGVPVLKSQHILGAIWQQNEEVRSIGYRAEFTIEYLLKRIGTIAVQIQYQGPGFTAIIGCRHIQVILAALSAGMDAVNDSGLGTNRNGSQQQDAGEKFHGINIHMKKAGYARFSNPKIW